MSLSQNRLQSIYRQLADSLVDQYSDNILKHVADGDRYIKLKVSADLLDELKTIKELGDV